LAGSNNHATPPQIPLLNYLDSKGRYEGFDAERITIEWCNKRIASRHSNFRFQFVDVRTRHYNPKGRYKPSEFRFPYPDNTFDFFFLASVFTHMLPEDVEN